MQSIVRKAFFSGLTVRSNSLKTCVQGVHRYMSSDQTDGNYYDVIISGSGLVGGAMACAIGSSPYFENKKVLVLEAQPNNPTGAFDNVKPYSNRVCAISPGSMEFLSELGAWEMIDRKANVRKMQVWDACSDALITFQKDEMTEDLCYIVENNLITDSLKTLMHKKHNSVIDVMYETKIKSLEVPRNYGRKDYNEPLPDVSVELCDGTILNSSLLIAADGSNSFIVNEVGMEKNSYDYDQAAIVATLKLSEPTENIVAWQRFLPKGPIAMLPLDEEHSSLVWSTSHDRSKELLEMTDGDFVTEINNAFYEEYPKGIITRIQDNFQQILTQINPDGSSAMQLPPLVAGLQGHRAKFPLGLSFCLKYVRPRLALIGDSSHRVHPLAGQGANLGFGDVKCLISKLDEAIYQGKDIGNLSHLLKYEKERQQHNGVVQSAIHGLNWLYSTDNTPLVALRTIGLMTANASTRFKEKIIKEAMSL